MCGVEAETRADIESCRLQQISREPDALLVSFVSTGFRPDALLVSSALRATLLLSSFALASIYALCLCSGREIITAGDHIDVRSGRVSRFPLPVPTLFSFIVASFSVTAPRADAALGPLLPYQKSLFSSHRSAFVPKSRLRRCSCASVDPV